MVLVNFFKNQIDNECVTYNIEEGQPIKSLKLDISKLVVYNQETKETTYREQSLESCSIIVNGKEVNEDYVVQADDVISIYPRQYSGDAATVGTGVTNILLGIGVAVGIGFVAVTTGGLGAIFLGGIGLALGGTLVASGVGQIGSVVNKEKTKKTETGDVTEQFTSIKGGKNQSIVGQRFPFVFGTHLVTPYFVGNPYTEISSKNGIGDVQTQKQLLAVGYSPLRITDIKFGENIVAYNRDTDVNGNTISHKNIFHGSLVGTAENDTGDIVSKWENNNIKIEVLQDFNNTDEEQVYGHIYPQAVHEKEVNADAIFIYDKDLENNAQVVYKNVNFTGGFRTNTVRFSSSCPSKIEVELDFPQGLFATNNYTDDSLSEPRYYKIPCNVAVQWRYIKKYDSSPNAESPEGWTSFTSQGGVAPVTYTQEMANKDIAVNKGLTAETSSLYNTQWIGAQCFALGDYDDTSYKKGTVNINERRYVFSYDFSKEEALNLCGEGLSDVELDSVEVRVVRLTPMFLDQTGSVSSSANYSNMSYQDFFKWTKMRTFMFDKEKFLEQKDSIQSLSEIPLRPLSLSDMRKLCLIAVSFQADETGNLSDVDSINVIASSLNPNYDKQTQIWVPAIALKKKYWQKTKSGDVWVTVELSESMYNQKLQNREQGLYKTSDGNDFVDKIKNYIFKNPENKDGLNTYELTNEIQEKYISSNPASIAALAVVGQHLGVDAKNLEEFDDLSTFYKHCEDVVDGRKDSSSPDGLKHIKYCCDGVLSSEKKLETFLTEVCITGRAALSYNSKGKRKVVIDTPKKYPEMIISPANCISRTFSRSFEDSPSGYECSFIDKADGYDRNSLHIMADGENYKHPTKEIQPLNLPYIVNRDHLWSLGRYILANFIMQKDVYTCVMGKVGRLLKFGSYVLIKDDTLKIDTDKGSRIQQLIEDDEFIYGFVVDGVYEYTGELENGKSKKGFSIVQPHVADRSRCVTLRFCTPDGVKMKTGELLKPTIGVTNVVILEQKISKESSSELVDGNWVVIQPKIGNLVEFGEVGSITKPALVKGVKKNDKGTYTVTLCAYNENIYNYGAELPVIQQPKPMKDSSVNEYNIKESIAKTDIQDLLNSKPGPKGDKGDKGSSGSLEFFGTEIDSFADTDKAYSITTASIGITSEDMNISVGDTYVHTVSQDVWVCVKEGTPTTALWRHQGRRVSDKDDSNLFRLFSPKTDYSSLVSSVTKEVVQGENPFGFTEDLLKFTNKQGIGNEKSFLYNKENKINYNRSYRYVCYVKQEGGTYGEYFGVTQWYDPSPHVENLDGTVSPSGYHVNSQNFGTFGRWYMVVAYVMANGLTEVPSDSGVYDMVSKKKIRSVNNFRWKKGVVSIPCNGTLIRFSSQNQTVTESSYFYDMRFDEMNGSEPTLTELLYGRQQDTIALESLEQCGGTTGQLGLFQGQLYKWNGTSWDLAEGVLPTDPVLHYSFDELPDLPDGKSFVYKKNKDFTTAEGFSGYASVENSCLVINFTKAGQYSYKSIQYSKQFIYISLTSYYTGTLTLTGRQVGASNDTEFKTINVKTGEKAYFACYAGYDYVNFNFYVPLSNTSVNKIVIESIYIGDGSYSSPLIDNAGKNNADVNGVVVKGVSGKGFRTLTKGRVLTNSPFSWRTQRKYTISLWVYAYRDYVYISNNYFDNNLPSYHLFTLHQAELQWASRFDVAISETEICRFVAFLNFPKEKWFHIVAIADGENSRVYFDNVKQSFYKDSITTISSGKDILSIGGFYDKYSNYEGVSSGDVIIDDFQIFDRALSEQEVLGLYLAKGNTPKQYTRADYEIENKPIYLGIAETAVPSYPTKGSWFTASKTFGSFTQGNVYQWTGVEWVRLDPEDPTKSQMFMTALNDILGANATGDGFFSAVFAKALIANNAFIKNLQSQVITLTQALDTQGKPVAGTGVIQSSNYVSSGGLEGWRIAHDGKAEFKHVTLDYIKSSYAELSDSKFSGELDCGNLQVQTAKNEVLELSYGTYNSTEHFSIGRAAEFLALFKVDSSYIGEVTHQISTIFGNNRRCVINGKEVSQLRLHKYQEGTSYVDDYIYVYAIYKDNTSEYFFRAYVDKYMGGNNTKQEQKYLLQVFHNKGNTKQLMLKNLESSEPTTQNIVWADSNGYLRIKK